MDSEISNTNKKLGNGFKYKFKKFSLIFFIIVVGFVVSFFTGLLTFELGSLSGHDPIESVGSAFYVIYLVGVTIGMALIGGSNGKR